MPKVFTPLLIGHRRCKWCCYDPIDIFWLLSKDDLTAHSHDDNDIKRNSNRYVGFAINIQGLQYLQTSLGSWSCLRHNTGRNWKFCFDQSLKHTKNSLGRFERPCRYPRNKWLRFFLFPSHDDIGNYRYQIQSHLYSSFWIIAFLQPIYICVRQIISMK